MLQIRSPAGSFHLPALRALGLSNGGKDPLPLRGIAGVFHWFGGEKRWIWEKVKVLVTRCKTVRWLGKGFFVPSESCRRPGGPSKVSRRKRFYQPRIPSSSPEEVHSGLRATLIIHPLRARLLLFQGQSTPCHMPTCEVRCCRTLA